MTEMISYTPHGVVELSNLKATECGHIVNLLVNEESGIDNGSFVTFDIADASEGYVSTGLGIDVLGTAMVPSTDDAVYLVASMPMIYEDYTPKMLEESNFFNGMGEVARCFEVKPGDRFGLSKECFTNPEDVAVGKYVIISGNGYKSTVSDSMGDGAFVGYIYAQAANGNWYVFVLKNGNSGSEGDGTKGLVVLWPEMDFSQGEQSQSTRVMAFYNGNLLQSVTWTSDNENLVTVDGDTGMGSIVINPFDSPTTVHITGIIGDEIDTDEKEITITLNLILHDPGMPESNGFYTEARLSDAYAGGPVFSSGDIEENEFSGMIGDTCNVDFMIQTGTNAGGFPVMESMTDQTGYGVGLMSPTEDSVAIKEMRNGKYTISSLFTEGFVGIGSYITPNGTSVRVPVLSSQTVRGYTVGSEDDYHWIIDEMPFQNSPIELTYKLGQTYTLSAEFWRGEETQSLTRSAIRGYHLFTGDLEQYNNSSAYLAAPQLTDNVCTWNVGLRSVGKTEYIIADARTGVGVKIIMNVIE